MAESSFYEDRAKSETRKAVADIEAQTSAEIVVALRLPAIALTLASDIGFLLLGLGGFPPGLLRVAAFDAASILLLAIAAICAGRASAGHP